MSISDSASFNDQLLGFLKASTTPFHAVANMATILQENGFVKLEEGQHWQLQQGERYYLTRNGSSIIAFVYGTADLESAGFRIVGAHTDSPCLKLKPQPEIYKKGCLQLGVEIYGGALLNPWFDRDLSLAGRVSFLDEAGNLKQALTDFVRPIATVPSLAIHLDREANNCRSVNAQTDMPVLLSLTDNAKDFSFADILLAQLNKQAGPDARKILDSELYFYDCQAPGLTGLKQDFISSARLDNLLSCFIGLQSLIQADDKQTAILVCNDHEEVGSASAAGAQGPMLKHMLQRMLPSEQHRFRALHHSMMVSVDNAHAVHPNFVQKHDDNHGPILNKGVVIKINASQRYASNSETQAVFRNLAERAGQPVQSFVVRSDMGCGSTIGPITATELGVATVDVGVPQLAMHSIRELCGSDDPYSLYKILVEFFAANQVRVDS